MKTLKNTLSAAGIASTIGSLMAYKASFSVRMELLATRLYNEVGIPTVNDLYDDADGDSDKPHNTYFLVSRNGDRVTGILILEGKEAAFVEFGAGVHYNTAAGTSPHPKGVEKGYTIGSYGQGRGKYDSWLYKGDDGATHLSQGTEATMPLLNANKEMRDAVVRICTEVFQ